MANENQSRIAGGMRALFSFEMYKRTQGRLLRSLTVAGLALVLGWGLYAFSNQLEAKKPEWETKFLFSLKSDYSKELDAATLPKAFRDAFQNKGFSLGQETDEVAVSVKEQGTLWTIQDKAKGTKYLARIEEGELQVWTSGISREACDLIAYGVPGLLALVAVWVLFLVYNWGRFADFLIATEAEMSKVSWSSKDELKRATAVVLLTLFLLAAFLLSVDMVWSWFLEKIKVLHVDEKPDQAFLNGDSWRVAWTYLTTLV